MPADRGNDRPACGYCGEPQRGFAQVGDVAVCHPDWPADLQDDCYRMVTVYQRPLIDGRLWTTQGWIEAASVEP